MLLGYLSDIFGRRQTLLVTLSAMLVFNVISGLIQSPSQLFIMRALVSMATGAIGTLVGATLSDFTTVEDRVKYQGFAGVGTALGGSIGSIAGAALGMYHQWRVFYYAVQGFTTLAGLVMVAKWVPSSLASPTKAEVWKAIKTIDFVGITSLTGTVACGAVLLSQAGRSWAWDEPRVIILFVLFGLSVVAFSVAGFKNFSQVRPIIPFDIFRDRTVSLVCVQQFLLGGAYWAFLFFMPLLLQLGLDFDPLESACCMLPFLFTHGIWSAISGSLMNWTIGTSHGDDARMISYKPMFWFGFSACTISLALLCACDSKTSIVQVMLLECLFGLGTGSTFTNSIAALQAHTLPEQSAVVIGARAVIRGVGGSVFSTVASLIMTETLRKNLPNGYTQLANHAYSRPPLETYPAGVKSLIVSAWADGIRYIFAMAAVAMAFALLFTWWIKDDGLKKSDEPKERNRRMSVEHV